MRRAGLACVVLLAFAVSLPGCAGGGSSARSTSTPSVDPSPGVPAYVVTRLHVGDQPCAVEGGFGSIWVSVYGDGREVRIDPDSGRVIARIRTGYGPCGIAVGGGAVWVENYSSDTVTRIDPRTNKASTIDVGGEPYDVTYSAGAAWVTNNVDGTVTRIDAKTLATRTIHVGFGPQGIAPAGGAIWVANNLAGSVSRIDPRTLHVETWDVGTTPSWTSWGEGQLWVADGPALHRIDPADGRVTSGVETAAVANDGDVSAGRVWVPDHGGFLDAFDADTGARVGRWPLDQTNPFVLAAYAGRLWVVDFGGTTVEAVDPQRLP